MEIKELEDKEQRNAADPPETASAVAADDAGAADEETSVGADSGDAPNESDVIPAWWEDDGPRREETDDTEHAGGIGAATPGQSYIYRGTRLYRGVSYGESAPGTKSEAPEEPAGDHEPVDLSALTRTPEDPLSVAEDPPAQEPQPEEPVVESPWWETGSKPEEETGQTPDTYTGAGYTYRGVRYGASAPDPKSEAPEEPAGDREPMDFSASAWPPEDPPAREHQPEEPVVESPTWEARSKPQEASGEEAEGTQVSELESDFETAQEPADVHDHADAPVPAAMWEAAPGALDEEQSGAAATEYPTTGHGAPDREAAAWPPDSPEATEAPPEGSSGELIRSIVAEVCPGELLLTGTAEAPLPEWAGVAATAARDDLDRCLADGKPIDGREYLRLAIVENVLGLHEEADGHLKQALPRSEPFGPVLNALAVTNLARGRLAPAVVYCKEALRETGGDDSVRAAASSNLGDLYDLQGNAAGAAEAYETAINSLGTHGDSRWLSRLHLQIGRLYQRLGETDKAHRHFSDSVRLFKETGDEAGRVQALAGLGSALTGSGLHDLALRSLEEGVRICLRTGDRPGAALVQDEIGNVYMAQDQLTRALAYFEGALLLYRELGNREAEAATLRNMGKIHDSRGEIAEAQQFYETALQIHREPGDQVGQSPPGPDVERGDQDGEEAARARLLKAQEFLRRAESSETQ